ncbi:MAG: 50S ribosomal protein L10 [Spirochaetota bacterium]
MAQQYKIDFVNEIKETLAEKKNIILTKYSGVKVAKMSALRTEIKSKGAKYKVIKNNLFKRALDESGYETIDEHLKGPIGVAFAGDEIGDVAQVLKKFKDDQESFEYFLGIIENTVYNQAQLATIADLPPKEVLLGQILSLVNAPSSKIAMGMNQIMASLARGINAVAEKNNA